MQNSLESQDFVENPGGPSRSATQAHTSGAERLQEPPLCAVQWEGGGYPANGRATRGILEPDMETLRTGGGKA